VRPRWDVPANPREPMIHNRTFAPLSLALTASMLREEGIGVRIVDAHALRLDPQEVAGLVRDCDQVFVTSSALDRWECPNVEIEPFLACTRELTRVQEQVYVLGAHGTVRPVEILQQTGARAVVIGEPELPTVQIASARPLEQIPGLCIADQGDPIVTDGERELVDLDRQPLPAFELLPLERYHHVMMGPRSLMLEGSRGCPYRCTTCLQVMFGPRYRKKSGETLIREVRSAVERHKAKNIIFIDMEFCLNREPVEQLCEFLAGRGYDLQWCCSTRPDAVDGRLLKRMKAAGCTLIHYGVESGDPAVVDSIDKRLDLGRVEAAVRMTQEAGIEVLAFFMLGLPGETREQMRRTVRFAERLAPDYIAYHVFVPYPCTAAQKQMGGADSRPFPAGAPERELRQIARSAMLGFYLRPAFLLRYAGGIRRRGVVKQTRLFWSYLHLR
jgi:anaerobic magnesium-protoporphyrin IX monomethyl ester cyclase